MVHCCLPASLWSHIHSHVRSGLNNVILQEEWLEFEDPSPVET